MTAIATGHLGAGTRPDVAEDASCGTFGKGVMDAEASLSFPLTVSSLPVPSVDSEPLALMPSEDFSCVSLAASPDVTSKKAVSSKKATASPPRRRSQS